MKALTLDQGEALSCDECGNLTTASILFITAQDGVAAAPNVVQHRAPGRNYARNPDQMKDPCRYWFKEHGGLTEQLVNSCFLHAAIAHRTEEGITPKFIHSACHMDRGFCSNEDADQLGLIFASLLHPILFGNVPGARDKLPKRFGVKSFTESALKDQSTAMKCIYALATGRVLDDSERQEIIEKGHSEHRSTYLACFCAKEMLLRPYNKKPSRLQYFVSDLLYSNSGDFNKLNDMLSAFRLTASNSTVARHIAFEVNESMQRKMDLPSFGLTIFCNDNLNFTQKGQQATKVAYTLLVVHTVPPEELTRAGFYTQDPSKRISREKITTGAFLDGQATDGQDPYETAISPT